MSFELELKQNLFLIMGSLFHEAREYLDRQFKQYNLTRNEWLILALLRTHKGKVTQRFVKSYLGLETSYFTKILNELEKKNFIVRGIHPEDRRNRIIKINPKSAKKVKKIFKTIHDFNNVILSDLNKTQLQELHAFLAMISNRLQEFKN